MANAETFVFMESYRTFKKTAYQTNVVWGQQSFGNRLGTFGWAQYGKTYTQGYGGLYVKPVSWLQLGAGGGAEQAENKKRLGTFAYAAKSKYSAFAVYENGGSGYWYLLVTDVAVSKRFSVGSHSQAFIGHGPRAEIKIGKVGKWAYSLRPAATWDRESGKRPNFILGLRFSYFKGD